MHPRSRSSLSAWVSLFKDDHRRYRQRAKRQRLAPRSKRLLDLIEVNLHLQLCTIRTAPLRSPPIQKRERKSEKEKVRGKERKVGHKKPPPLYLRGGGDSSIPLSSGKLTWACYLAAAPQTVSVIRRATTYGSQLAFGRRSSR